MTPSIQPNSQTWTLRFKHRRTTILLHVDQLQRLTSVRAELLKAIQQTHLDGRLDGHDIPHNPDDILLARPCDVNDLGLGWEALDKDEHDNLFEESGKGKGKAGTTKADRDVLAECPKGVGLQDRGIVAFRFRTELDAATKVGGDEGQDVLDGETLVGVPAGQDWDVIVPTMDDSFPEEMMAD